MNNDDSTKSPEELAKINRAMKKKFQNKKLIFGQGFVGAKIVFVGEAPGAEEENDEKPITGQREKLLNQLLKSVGINKNKIYFTNVVKYFPSQKAPTPKEVKSYTPFLREEIKTINPQIVVTLGNIALNGVGMRQPLNNVHGRIFNLGSHELFPTFHPEHALKDEQVKTLLRTDFLKLKGLIKIKKPIAE